MSLYPIFERPLVDNPKSERIRKVVALSGRSSRLRQGLLLVEGPGAVRELLQHRPDNVVDVYVSEVAAERYADLVSLAQNVTKWVHPVTPLVSRTISTDSQGMVAVAKLEAIAGVLPRLDAALAAEEVTSQEVRESVVPIAAGMDNEPNDSAVSTKIGSSLRFLVSLRKIQGIAAPIVLLSRIQDPGNLGTLIRVADAFGARALIITSGSVEVSNPKVIRSSVGCCFHLPIFQHASFTEVVSGLRESGWLIFGTSGGGSTLDLDDLILSSLPNRYELGSTQRKRKLDLESDVLRPTYLPTKTSEYSLVGANELVDDGKNQRNHRIPEKMDLLRQAHAWVFGNEAQGMSQAELAACDYVVRLPMSGKAESLNVASAASCALYVSQLVRRLHNKE